MSQYIQQYTIYDQYTVFDQRPYKLTLLSLTNYSNMLIDCADEKLTVKRTGMKVEETVKQLAFLSCIDSHLEINNLRAKSKTLIKIIITNTQF